MPLRGETSGMDSFLRSVTHGIKTPPDTGGGLSCRPQRDDSCVVAGRQGRRTSPFKHLPRGGVFPFIAHVNCKPKVFLRTRTT